MVQAGFDKLKIWTFNGHRSPRNPDFNSPTKGSLMKILT